MAKEKAKAAAMAAVPGKAAAGVDPTISLLIEEQRADREVCLATCGKLQQPFVDGPGVSVVSSYAGSDTQCGNFPLLFLLGWASAACSRRVRGRAGTRLRPARRCRARTSLATLPSCWPSHVTMGRNRGATTVIRSPPGAGTSIIDERH